MSMAKPIEKKLTGNMSTTGKRFLNYEDPDWISDDYEWRKNEDGTNITKEDTNVHQ